MAGEKLASFGALAVPVVHFILGEGMRRADEPVDALFLVDDPAFDLELAKLGTAGEQRIFQCAEEGRHGQRVEQHGGRFDRELPGEGEQVGGGIGPPRLQQFVQLVRHDAGIEPRAGLRARGDLDSFPPDLHPAPARVEQFQPDQLGAARREHA